jgi:hypothetical protein
MSADFLFLIIMHQQLVSVESSSYCSSMLSVTVDIASQGYLDGVLPSTKQFLVQAISQYARVKTSSELTSSDITSLITGLSRYVSVIFEPISLKFYCLSNHQTSFTAQ